MELPAEEINQTIIMKIITEGETKIKVFEARVPSKRMPVFYNPEKEFDRTLSVEFVRKLRPKNALDLLAASGARGLRLMKEAGVKVTFNDLNSKAVRLIRENLRLNNLKATVHNKNASRLLYDLGEFWDFIDLDPFGTPNPYLDAAIKYTARHGILAVTATDTAALVGVKKEAGRRKYQASLFRHPFMKETGLRLLIRHVIERGAELELAMKPVMAHYTRHYFRAYFKKDLGARKCDELLDDIKYIYYDAKTGYRGFEQKGKEIGPVYTGSINSMSVVPEWKEEDNFPPWHYNVIELGFREEPKMNNILKKYDAIRAHYSPKAFKTKRIIFP